MSNSGQPVVRGPHKRDRPGSKAYINSLLQDIELLDTQLRQAGQEPPQPQNPLLKGRPLQHFRSHPNPGKSKLDGPANDHVGPARVRNRPISNNNSESDTSAAGPNVVDRSPARDKGKQKETAVAPFATIHPVPSQGDNNRINPSGLPLEARQRAPALSHSLFSPVQVVYDRSNGRVQYFCPSNCFKRYFSEHVRPQTGLSENRLLEKHPYRILADVPSHVQDYLMGLFWNRYNETFRVIDRKAFYDDMQSGGSTSYSGFLHISCLATGFLFADKKNRAMQHVTLPNKLSVFYREVKYLLDGEIENPQGLTTIQSMLVLSDVECTLGRDDVGGLYSGVACRLGYDYGLNLEHSQLGLSPAELQTRRRLLRSCILYDKGWSLYQGRPTSIKNSDIEVSQMTDLFSRMGNFGDSEELQRSARRDMGVDEVENLVLDAMLELLEMASKVQEKTHSNHLPGMSSDENALVEIAALGSNLNSWSARLPPQIRWSAENAKTAPSLFFIMHQQFHTTQALLHGPYGQYGEAIQDHYGGSCMDGVDAQSEVHSFVPLARSIALKHALKVVEIFAHHRARFGKGQFGMFSLTHAATATLVLTANASLDKNVSDRNLTLQRLRTLLEELTEMALIYQPAQMMVSVMEHYLQNTGMDLSGLPTTDPILTPASSSGRSFARRQNETDHDAASESSRKRRNTNNERSTIPDIPISTAPAGELEHHLPPIGPNEFNSHEHGHVEAEGEDFEVLDIGVAGRESGWNALDSTSLHNIPDNRMEPCLGTGDPLEHAAGSITGDAIPNYGRFSPSFLFNDSSDQDDCHQDYRNNAGDVFLGYHGEAAFCNIGSW